MACRSRRTAAMSGARSMQVCDEVWGKMHKQPSRWGFEIRVAVLARLLGVALAVNGPGAVATDAQAAPGDGRIVLPEDVIPAHYDVEVTPDVAHLRFSGRARIDVDVRQQTRRIELNAADLTFERVRVEGRTDAPRVELDEQQQTATFIFDTPLAPGHHVLALDYRGRIYQQASGLFVLDYEARGLPKQHALFTQFENSDARRFLPCWDEPGRKATFTLSAVIKSADSAVSNMPVAHSENAGMGLKRVRFETTPQMSSYLLFFAAGDFERVHRKVGGVDLGVIAKRGEAQRSSFALDMAAELLPYYNDYFGTPYPLPKLDLIAAPGSSQFFSAMENWGAMFFFEKDLLIDARLSTEDDRQNVAVVIAHEMAHQWFGDLVTMAWWDDLWLNEGFASWMENKAVDHFHPRWKLWLQNQASVQLAMGVDAGSGTHPIITPIKDVLEASNAFDAITYEKGSAVIRMLEAYVGADAFRAGVRRYLRDHAYGNTVTDDLWSEIDAVSPRKVRDIAHDFTLRAGVPLVRAQEAHCDHGHLQLSLSQARFSIDDSGARGAQVWHVPVAVLGLGEPEASHLIVSGPAAVAVQLPSCEPALLNAGETAYFRSRYAPEAFAALAEHYAQLSAADQLGLLDDTEALASVDQVPIAQYLVLTTKVRPDGEPLIWIDLAQSLVRLDGLYEKRPGRGEFRAYARQLLQRPFARVGWDARPGEGDNTENLRATLLDAMGRFADPAVVTEARRRYRGFITAPARFSAAQRKNVLDVVAENADAATWDELHARARAASTDLEKQEYYRLLGSAADPLLAQRALDVSLTPEAPVTLRPAIIEAVATDHPELATDFAMVHWDAIAPTLETDSRTQYVPDLASNSTDLGMIARLKEFAAGHIPASAHSSLDKAIARIHYRVQISSRLSAIDHWIATLPLEAP
jgi:aminopeptidase N